MGWLLSIWLALPPVPGEVEVRMWFSRESYCTFAEEKFTENPMRLVLPDGSKGEAKVARSRCRPLAKDEAELIPPHMRSNGRRGPGAVN